MPDVLVGWDEPGSPDGFPDRETIPFPTIFTESRARVLHFIFLFFLRFFSLPGWLLGSENSIKFSHDSERIFT